MPNSVIKSLFFIFAFIFIQTMSIADTLEFAQIGDVHYSLNDTDKEKYLYFLSMSLRKKYPDFVVFLGDNVEKSKEENVIGFMRAIHSIRQPYYLLFGDKDAHTLGGLEKETYLDIVSAFNRNQDSDKKYYYFKPNKDFICVVLDNTPDFAPSKHGEISDEQLVWLEKLLIKYPKRMFIIFQHSPLVAPRDDYQMSMLNTEKYSELLKKYSNILLISAGHYHQSSIKTDDNGIRHINAPAFKDIPHSYQLIKIIYDENSYISPKNVEITVTPVKV